jgi:hypothetical protein
MNVNSRRVTGSKIYKVSFYMFNMGKSELYLPLQSRFVYQIEEFAAKGKVPLNSAQLMLKQIETMDSQELIRSQYISGDKDLGDAIIFNSNGNNSWNKLKVILDSKDLRNITEESLKDGNLILTNEIYDALDAEEFNKKDVLKYFNYLQSERESNINPILLSLSRGDKGLLSENNHYLYKLNSSDKGGAIFIPKSISSNHLYALHSGRGENYYFSFFNYLYGAGSLVGVSSEIAMKINKRLEERASTK